MTGKRFLFTLQLLTVLVTEISFYEVHAQQFNFSNYTIEDGLSQSQHKLIFQDSRGFLWFGSYEGGLTRYDGYEFKVFNEKKGLINDKVQSIAEDAEGNIWIGTFGGLSIFSGSNFKNVEFEVLSGKSILSLKKHPNGSMWIGTSTDGLFVYTGNKLVRVNDLIDKPFDITFDFSFAEEKVFVAADRALIRFSINSQGYPEKKVTSFFQPELRADVLTVLARSASEVFIGKSNGLYTLTNEVLSKLPELNNVDVRHLSLNAKNEIWIGSYGDGAYLIKKDGVERIHSSSGLINNRVQYVLEEKSGTIWFATFGGVSKLSGMEFLHLREEDGLKSNFIWGLKEGPAGELWIAHNEGVSVYHHGQITNLDQTHGFNGSKAWAVMADLAGKIWIGTNDGLYYAVDGELKLKKLPELAPSQNKLIFTLFIDSKNQLWTGGDMGINIIDQSAPANSKLFPFQLPAMAINTIFEDKKGRVWIGLEAGGLFVYANNKLDKISGKNGVNSEIINEVREDLTGNIWVGTSLDGLYKIPADFESMASFEVLNYGEENGLLSENIYAMLVDTLGYLWIGTERGVQQLDVRNDELSIRTYSKREGFSGMEVNHKAVTQAANGDIWWGTIKGASKHMVRTEQNVHLPPDLFITGLDFFFQKAVFDSAELASPWDALPKSLVLPHTQNHLTFRYTGIDIAGNHQLRYQFKLEGLHEDWFPVTDNREAVYSNIPPGKYNFRLKAFRETSPEVYTEISYNFEVLFPLWQRWWFIALMVVLLIVGILLYVKIRVYQLRVQRIELTKKVKARTKEIEYQKHEIEEQKSEIESQRDQLELKSNQLEHLLEEVNLKNLQITDSLMYAQKIQEAIFPKISTLQHYFRDIFVFYKPRDIVSGDFYWFLEKEKKAFLVVADCTGHGVPGAFMSIIGNSLLNQAILEAKLTDPSEILRSMHRGIRNALKQFQEDTNLQDGMDMALCIIDQDKKQIKFAGAHRPIYIVDDGVLTEIKGDKNSIGGFEKDYSRQFATKTIPWSITSTYFLLTDGFADQFGGKEDKKFLVKRLKELLTSHAHLSMQEIEEKLEETFQSWKGNSSQTDDILIVGFKTPLAQQ